MDFQNQKWDAAAMPITRTGRARARWMVAMRMISDNPHYAEQSVDMNEGQPDFQIIGRVVWSPPIT